MIVHDDMSGVEAEIQLQVQKRRGKPEEVANVILFLLSEQSTFVTGAVYRVDGGWVC